MMARLKAWFEPSMDLDAGHEMRRMIRFGLAVIVVGLGGVVTWAVLAQLGGAVIAQGFVKVDMNRKVVQHQEGGIVKEIRIRDGERVAAAQPLIVLEDVRVDATFDLLRQQLESERAKNARLESERLLAPRVAFPKDIESNRANPRTAEVIDRETALFRARREALDSQIAVLRKQIVESGVEAKALSDQIAAEERGIGLAREELAVNEKLVRENFIQRTRIIALERNLADIEARFGEHRAELSKTKQRGSELELRILSMRNAYVQTATDEQKDSSGKIYDLEERLRPSKDAAERQVIRAPIAGEVVGLKVFSAGAVIGPRDMLLEIVPDEKTLIIEARIRPEDINHVRVGTPADVRLTAYKQRTTPLVEGKITYVSGDRLVESAPGAPQGVPYYSIHVIVSHQALEAAGNLRMSAGMPAEVYVRTDERTTFDYFLAPVTAYFRRGMREPL
jgi:HlyD family type I secretion membrane fusion protein